MAKQTRVEKYKKLRSDIDKMDTYSLEQIERDNRDRKQTIVKESIRHAAQADQTDVKAATLTMSIDELLEGHSEYIGAKEEEIREQVRRQKQKLRRMGLVTLGIVLIGVLIIVIIAYLNNK